ncbi:MAG: Triosephosphate isomerase [Hyphomicrobiales bacterium]|nr:Triosephosphate isomerase [Hyphomicrobiales bacterium]
MPASAAPTPARPRPLVAGNWKMNGLEASLAEIAAMAGGYDDALRGRVDLLVCPPATLVGAAVAACAGKLAVGGQDCHPKASGAHTGDVAAEMLADLGAAYVIVGHSERRADHGESDAVVKSKAEAALRAGLVAIVCVGETEAQRRAGEMLDVVGAQIAGSLPAGASARNLVVAYEPVWAIGTGLTPTPADVAQVHGFIRERLAAALGEDGAGVRILYGGSVKPSNAAELMGVANVDGALVGGASLTAKDFLGIAAAYRSQ